MKKLFFLFALHLAISLPNAIAQNREDENLKKFVRSETEAFMRRDSAAWKSHFIQDETTIQVYVGNGYYESHVGWRKISPPFLSRMKENPKPSRYTDIKNSNYIINQSGDLAFMIYDQQISVPNVDTLKPNATREFRTLVRKNQQWKISSIMTIDTPSFRTTSPDYVESLFNATGYNFMAEKKTDDAIEIFRLNVKLYPQAWNTYDSLGEAYAAAGNKKLAIENYEKSIKLNPKNEIGKAILEKLKKE